MRLVWSMLKTLIDKLHESFLALLVNSLFVSKPLLLLWGLLWLFLKNILERTEGLGIFHATSLRCRDICGNSWLRHKPSHEHAPLCCFVTGCAYVGVGLTRRDGDWNFWQGFGGLWSWSLFCLQGSTRLEWSESLRTAMPRGRSNSRCLRRCPSSWTRDKWNWWESCGGAQGIYYITLEWIDGPRWKVFHIIKSNWYQKKWIKLQQ